jgi:thymidylate kinase
MTKLVVVTGPDGAGKSSVCEILLQNMDKAIVIDIWRGLNESPFYPSKTSIHEYLKAIDPSSRALLILHSLSRSLHLAQAAKPSLIIADGYWYKYAVTELALTGDTSMMRVADAMFPIPSLTVFLDVKPETALRRKKEFSAYEAGFADDKDDTAFHGFQTRIYDKWLGMRSLNPDWRILDTQPCSVENVADQIKRLIADA